MESVIVLVSCIVIGAAVGYAWGRGSGISESYFVLKARKQNRTPIHVRGKFYYVISEPELCREWRRVHPAEIPECKVCRGLGVVKSDDLENPQEDCPGCCY